MIVLKSTFDKTAKLAKAACISRDLWRKTAQTNGKLANELLAERDALQAKVDRMTGGLRQNRGKQVA